MKHFIVHTALACAALCSVGSAHAAPATLADCRVLTDATARLACYDALPLALVAPTTEPPARAPAPTAVASAEKQPAGGWFGLSKPKAPEAAIASAINGHVAEWHKGTVFKLANGQTWQVTDDDAGSTNADNPRITIEPGFLGSYFLKFENLNIAVRVKRVE